MTRLFCWLFALSCASAAFAQSTPPSYKQVARFAIGGEGGWDYISYEPNSNRLFVGHSTEITVIDAGTGQKIGSVPAIGAHVTGHFYPDFYSHWNEKAISGRHFLGAPAEEYLYAFTFGAFWVPLYEAWKQLRIRSDSATEHYRHRSVLRFSGSEEKVNYPLT